MSRLWFCNCWHLYSEAPIVAREHGYTYNVLISIFKATGSKRSPPLPILFVRCLTFVDKTRRRRGRVPLSGSRTSIEGSRREAYLTLIRRLFLVLTWCLYVVSSECKWIRVTDCAYIRTRIRFRNQSCLSLFNSTAANRVRGRKGERKRESRDVRRMLLEVDSCQDRD